MSKVIELELQAERYRLKVNSLVDLHELPLIASSEIKAAAMEYAYALADLKMTVLSNAVREMMRGEVEK